MVSADSSIASGLKTWAMSPSTCIPLSPPRCRAASAAPPCPAWLAWLARVVARVVRQFRGKKIIIQKFRRRKNHRRRRGHRQYHTSVQITSVVGPA